MMAKTPGSVPVAQDPLSKDSGSLGSLRNLGVLLGQKGTKSSASKGRSNQVKCLQIATWEALN